MRKLTLKCPKCGNRSIQPPAGQNKTGNVTCPGCGHSGPVDKFIDAPSKKAVMDEATKLARDAFKNIKGFK